MGNITETYIYGTKPNVPDYLIKNGKTYKILSDNLGSVRMVVDIQTGKTVQEISFFTKEPLGFAGSMNFYIYCDGDSVNFVDVSGLKPGDLFDTMDEAGVDAILPFLSLSISEDREYGGFIVEMHGKFMALPAYAGEYGTGIVNLNKAPCNAVASYHTHGRDIPGVLYYENFSKLDRFSDTDDVLEFGYLGTPKGFIKKITYRYLEQGGYEYFVTTVLK